MLKTADKLTIAVDIDDVVSSSAVDFVKFSNEMWGTNLTVEDYDEHWARLWKVDDEESHKRANIITESKLPLKYSHIENAEWVLRELAQKYKIVAATSRNKTMQGMTLEWLNSRYGDIFDEVHFAGLWDKDTDLDSMSKLTKAELLKQIGADYLIDDQPKHCIAAAQVGLKTLLFGNYKWNRDAELVENMVRVANWEEVLEYFNEQSR